MRKASQSSGNHHGLGHTPKSFVYLASADVQSEHHLPLLPRQPWESFSMEKLNQLFMLCNWLSTRGHCKMRGIEGSYFCHDFLKPSFSSKHIDVSNFPPRDSRASKSGIFFELVPPASSESSPKQDSVSSSMKISRSSWQSVRNIVWSFCFPLWPLMSRWANMFAKFGFGVSGGLLRFPPTDSIPMRRHLVPGTWGNGHLSHWICARLFSFRTPQSESTVSTVFGRTCYFQRNNTPGPQMLRNACIRCHKKKKVTAGQDHSEKEW